MSNIAVTAYDRTGRISFSIYGKRYTYFIDAIYLQKPEFKSWIKYAPGKALNFVKKNGELLSGPKTKNKQPEMPEDACPSCGSQNHVQGVNCPNCDYNESFSFKNWLDLN